MPIPDYDKLLVGQYIRDIENPDSIGFKQGKWCQSSRRGDDPHNRGFGIDVEYNDRARKLTEGRMGKWLTEHEERDLRNQHINYSERILDKWIPKMLAAPPSEAKKAMAVGMLYRGDGIKSIINNPELRDAFYHGTNEDFQKVVDVYYRSKNLNERARNHTKFMENHTSEAPQKPNWNNAVLTFSSGGFLHQTKTAWDNLSMLGKAEMMKVAVRNGITDLKTIREKYNEFAKGGNLPQTDWSYASWKKQIAAHKDINVDNDNTYDYESFFKENPQMAWKILNDAPDAHFPDTYKTAYHPTFSTLSLYSGQYHSQHNPQALKGGKWNKEGTIFIMSSDGYRGPVNMDDRKWYLENAEDFGVQLREADGSLPVYDGTPWGGVLPNVTITGKKKSLGGELRGPLVEAALYGDGGKVENTQQIQQGHAIYLNYPNAKGSLVGAVRFGNVDVGAALGKLTGITSLPFGHAGVILVDKDGNSNYYDYGRYNEGTDKYGVSTFGAIKPRKGNWRTKKLPKQKVGENDSVYVDRIQKGLPDTQFGEYQALSFPNVNVGKAKSFINSQANDQNRKSYGIGNTCVDTAYKSIVPFLQNPEIVDKIVNPSLEEYNTEGYSPFATFWSQFPGTVGYTSAAMRKIADKTYIMNKKK